MIFSNRFQNSAETIFKWIQSWYETAFASILILLIKFYGLKNSFEYMRDKAFT